METPKPHLIAGLLCEKVLQEKDGSLTVVRIADRVTYDRPEGLPESAEIGIALAGLVAIKSGSIKGAFNLRIVINSPSGKRQEGPLMPVVLEGGDQGQNFILNFSIGLKEEGVYWFDVMFEDEVLTRIPLVVAKKKPIESEKQ